MMEDLGSVPKGLRTLWRSSMQMAVLEARAENAKEKQAT